MKTMMLMALLLYGGAAFADDDLEKYWSLFAVADNTPDAAIHELTAIGLSEQGAKDLTAYMVHATEALAANVVQEHKDMCARRDVLKSDPNGVADAIKRIDDNYTAGRRGWVANIPLVLSAEDERILREHLYSERPPEAIPLEAVSFDTRVRSGQVDLDVVLDRVCNFKLIKPQLQRSNAP